MTFRSKNTVSINHAKSAIAEIMWLPFQSLGVAQAMSSDKYMNNFIRKKELYLNGGRLTMPIEAGFCDCICTGIQMSSARDSLLQFHSWACLHGQH